MGGLPQLFIERLYKFKFRRDLYICQTVFFIELRYIHIGQFILNYQQKYVTILTDYFQRYQASSLHFKLQQNQMDFYELQQQRIAEDQQDNELIQTLTKNYAALKVKYQNITQSNLTLNQEVAQLREQNQKLETEINELKSSQKIQSNAQLKTEVLIDNQTTNFYRSTNNITPMAFRTVDRSMCSQLTKRRVINSFAEELTIELEQSEETLSKERKMHQQTRRTLQVCNEEMSTLRIKAKDLQNRVLNLTLENQKLFQELDAAIKQRRGLQQHYSIKMKEKNQRHRNLLLNLQEFEEEMSKMDYIYQNIEYELSLKT